MEYTNIYVRTSDGSAPLVRAEILGEDASIVELAGRCSAPEGATHTVENSWIYRPGGGRDWPHVADTLMLLLTSPNVTTVWYYGDYTSPAASTTDAVCTLDRVRTLTSLYFEEMPRRALHEEWARMLGLAAFPCTSM